MVETIAMIRTADRKESAVHPNEVENMKACGWIVLKAGELENEGSEPSPSDVLALFDDTGVHFKTAQAAAKKLLGDDSPDTKDGLVEALKAMGNNENGR